MRTPSFLRNKAVQATLGLGAAGALLLTGGAVQAALVGVSGSYIERTYIATENNAYVNSSATSTWQNVPNMSRSVTIASGTRRALDVSYTAESQCTGTSGWCSVRAVVINSAGTVTELNPVASTDFAFDSADATDNWESNAINRTSSFLPAGTYTVRIQSTEVGAVGTLRLDDQHLKVGVLRP